MFEATTSATLLSCLWSLRFFLSLSGSRRRFFFVKQVHHSYISSTSDGWIFDKFNEWGGKGCNIFVPVLGVNGTKIAPTGDVFDQSPGQMR